MLFTRLLKILKVKTVFLGLIFDQKGLEKKVSKKLPNKGLAF